MFTHSMRSPKQDPIWGSPVCNLGFSVSQCPKSQATTGMLSTRSFNATSCFVVLSMVQSMKCDDTPGCSNWELPANCRRPAVHRNSLLSPKKQTPPAPNNKHFICERAYIAAMFVSGGGWGCLLLGEGITRQRQRAHLKRTSMKSYTFLGFMPPPPSATSTGPHGRCPSWYV